MGIPTIPLSTSTGPAKAIPNFSAFLISILFALKINSNCPNIPSIIFPLVASSPKIFLHFKEGASATIPSSATKPALIFVPPTLTATFITFLIGLLESEAFCGLDELNIVSFNFLPPNLFIFKIKLFEIFLTSL